MAEYLPSVGELAGLCGYDGANWQKLNLLFGYQAQYSELVQEIGSPGGTRWLYGATVPSGEVWVVKNIHAYDTVTTITRIALHIYDGATYRILRRVAAPVANDGTDMQCDVAMKAGDMMAVAFVGVVAGDNLSASFVGYKMKVS